jgi:His-Xaa-Ser system protein HxsD
MTTTLPGLPPDRVRVDLDTGAASIDLDQELYPLDALFGAAYLFLDRCYLLLDRPAADRVRVTLTPRGGAADAETARALAGEFANELLSCAWRQRVVAANRPLIEAVTSRALAAAMGPPSLDELAAFDYTDPPFDDPLGIAVPWEEKYGRGAGAAAEGGPTAAAERSEQDTAAAADPPAQDGPAGAAKEGA